MNEWVGWFLVRMYVRMETSLVWFGLGLVWGSAVSLSQGKVGM